MNKIIILLLTGIALILMQACGSSAKEADLPVRKSCNLERLYKDMPKNIRTDTLDLAFVNALCAGKADEVAALLREKKLFWDERSDSGVIHRVFLKNRTAVWGRAVKDWGWSEVVVLIGNYYFLP